jgi:hypothetical protein
MSEKAKDSTAATSGKGKATPKRKTAEAKLNVNAIASTDKKRNKSLSKEQLRAQRISQRAAYMRGDESALPLRDRGEARRFVRDYIDSRRTIGEYFLPVIMIVLVLTVVRQPAVQALAVLFMYSAMLYSVVSGFVISRKIKRIVAAKFPNEPLKGIGTYGWLRSTQLRRLRAPAPRVARGERPE